MCTKLLIEIRDGSFSIYRRKLFRWRHILTEKVDTSGFQFDYLPDVFPALYERNRSVFYDFYVHGCAKIRDYRKNSNHQNQIL